MTRVPAGSLCALLLVLTACTTKTTTAEQQSPSPSESVSVSASPSAPDTEDLAALVFDQSPPGYKLDPGETKGLTLDSVAEQADDPEAERTRLKTHGFFRGFIRTWVSDDDSQNVVYAFVYEFGSADGAKADAQSGIEEARAGGDRVFDIAGVNGATGIEHKPQAGSEGDQDTVYAAGFVRGARYYLVTIGGPTPHSQDEVEALAKQLDAKAR